MEINFLMSAQERVISSFKSNKRYIEKELSQLFQNSKKLKRSAKDGADDALAGFDSLIAQIDKLKEQYQRMLEVEDKLMSSLEQRLAYLKKVSKNRNDPEVLQGYFETRLNRVILDYFLHNNMYDTAKTFSGETGIEAFSNIEIFIETNQVLEKLDVVIHEESKHFGDFSTAQEIKQDALRNQAIDAALAWCNTYKTKLQNSGSQLEFHLKIQQIIQFIRNNKTTEAVEFAQQHFRKFVINQQSAGTQPSAT